MKILKMTATFGKLDNAELVLQDGFNVIHAPNEFGKSTWAAFILTMLYGIDTAQRASKTTLPIKTKYQPWNGKPMAGSMDILWKNKRITLERWGNNKTPMGEFKAFYTDSREICHFFTKDTCGETLLGVQRSVYEKSGFIGQQSMFIGPDSALETRLMSLVTTADESVSYTETKKQLQSLRNLRRHHKTGLLPQLELKLSETKATIQEMSGLSQEAFSLRGQILELQENLKKLQIAHDAQQMEAQHHQAESLSSARENMVVKEAIAREFAAKSKSFPTGTQLENLHKAMNEYTISKAQLPNHPPEMPSPPPCPPGFDSIAPNQVKSHAKSVISQLPDIKIPINSRKFPIFWPFIPIFILALVLFAMNSTFTAIPTGLSVLYLAYYLFSRYCFLMAQKRRTSIDNHISNVLKTYHVKSPEQLLAVAEDYGDALLLHGQAIAIAEKELEQFHLKNRDFALVELELFNKCKVFSPTIQDENQCHAFLHASANFLRQAQSAIQEFSVAKQKYEAISALVGEASTDGNVASFPNVSTHFGLEIQVISSKLQMYREKLAQIRGRLSTLGDIAELESAAEEYSLQIARLEQEYRCLTMAIDALDKANAQLQTRFSPQLNRVATEFFSILTNEKYQAIFVEQAMTLQTREAGEIPTRGTLNLSGGTLDQLYLAVRLAMHQLFLKDAAPLVLDDALAFFDDQRAESAMKLLQKISKSTQIILFSCHTREKNLLS